MLTVLIELLGWLAAGTTVAAYAMKTMLPLRIMAITSSVCFLSYGFIIEAWPVVAMELCILPINVWRLWQIVVLKRRVGEMRGARRDDFSVLKAYSKAREYGPGEVIFQRGDRAAALYFIASGSVRIEEVGLTLGAGEIFGEIAFFTDAASRTATVRTESDAAIHEIDEATFMRLYFQDPAFGMAVMRTITRRLVDGMSRAPGVYRDLSRMAPVSGAGPQ